MYTFLQVEAGLKQTVKGVNDDIKKVQNNIENVASNESNLETKMEKKKVRLKHYISVHRYLCVLNRLSWKEIRKDWQH